MYPFVAFGAQRDQVLFHIAMRKGFEGLYGLVRERLSCEPLSGHLFLFCNAQRNRLKVLVWDGSGLWVCAKRLEKGRFT